MQWGRRPSEPTHMVPPAAIAAVKLIQKDTEKRRRRKRKGRRKRKWRRKRKRRRRK